MEKKKLFSVTRDDVEWSYYKVSGAGGQHRDKTSAGVRIYHAPSGVSVTAGDDRSQNRNRIVAWRKMFDDPKFQLWLRKEIALRSGIESKIQEYVEKAVQPQNLRVEVKNKDGLWEEIDDSHPLS